MVGAVALVAEAWFAGTMQLSGTSILLTLVLTAAVFVPLSGELHRLEDARARSCLRATGRVDVVTSFSQRLDFTRTYLHVGDITFRAVFDTDWGPFVPDPPKLHEPSASVDYTRGRKYVLDIRDDGGHVLFRRSGYKPAP